MDEAPVRLRLLAVLWERLAELEADATREAVSRRTDWGDETICPRCKKETGQLRDGVCMRCFRASLAKADEHLERRALTLALRRGELYLSDLRGPRRRDRTG